MRSAWSPTRSMSFDTFLDVWPNCLLAFPTVLATDFTSRAGSFALPIERGSVMPRTFGRRERRLSTRPPTSPAAAAPAATAGPLALLATSLAMPTTPLRLWLLVERAPLLRARVEADDFERDDEPPEERDEPLRDEPPRDEPLVDREDPAVFAFGRALPELLEPEVFEPEFFEAGLFDPELLDERLLPLRDADLLVAIRDTPSIENVVRSTRSTHLKTR